MELFIFLLSALGLYVFLNGIFISMTTNGTNIKAFCPKFSSPKFRLNFWMELEDLLGCYAFHYLNNLRWIHRRNTLYQKMNMILIRAYFNENYLIPVRYFQANRLQTLIY